MKTNSWLSILGSCALAACGQAAESGEPAPAPEAAVQQPQANAPVTNTSMVTKGFVGDVAEAVAVPRGVQVSDAEAEARGPATWLRNRELPPKGVVLDNHELETEVGR